MTLLRNLKLSSLNCQERVAIVLAIACFAYFLYSVALPGPLDQRPAQSLPSQNLTMFTPKNGFTTPTSKNGFTIYTSGCQIESINPFDKSILSFIKKVPPYSCKKDIVTGLVYKKNHVLHVNGAVKKKVLAFHKTRAKNFYCCVASLKRYSVETNDNVTRKSECTKFTDKTPILDEFMSIACYLSKAKKRPPKLIYQNFDFAVFRKSDVEARCRAYAQLHEHQCEQRLSVLILGIDSVSRQRSVRHLQRTRQVLRGLDAVEFVGYNRVADNTYPNFGAGVLAGRRAEDLDMECIDENKFLDRCTFLGDYFGASGYRTAHVENMNFANTFAFSKNGFHRQTVDYCGRTFFNAIDTHRWLPYCYRVGVGVPDDQAVFQFAEEFQTEFAADPHFGVFWISDFSHHDFNRVANIDQFLPDQLNRLVRGTTLNNTVLVVLSDHGARFGSEFRTPSMRRETNLPMFFLILPPWFHRKYPLAVRTLRQNAQTRLTTHYDLHATLRSIVSCSGGFYKREKEENGPPFLGINLFDPVPENRTCADANIPIVYCSCIRLNVSMSVTDGHARMLGSLVVDKLNELIHNYRKVCAHLRLSWVKAITAQTNVSGTDNEYSVVIATAPGGGAFELFVNYRASNQTYTVEQDVLRLNTYGNSSECIRKKAGPVLVPICFCKKKGSS